MFQKKEKILRGFSQINVVSTNQSLKNCHSYRFSLFNEICRAFIGQVFNYNYKL